MTRPRRPRTKAAAPSVSFEAFSRTVLKAWHTKAPDTASSGGTYARPQDAASRATYEATVAQKGQEGVVLVSAADAGSAKACLGYLSAYFADEVMLSRLVRKSMPDGVELRSGISIKVSSDATRRPKGLLSLIRLDAAEVENPKPRDLARAILSVVVQHGPDHPDVVKMRKVLGPEFETILSRMQAREADDQFRDHEERRDFFRAASQAPIAHSGVPVMPRTPETPEELMAAQQEADRARKEMRGWDKASKVIRRKP